LLSRRYDILVVDDQKSFQAGLRLALEPRYRCHAAHSAEEAIALLRERDYNLILLDILLPEMSGLDFLRLVKKDARTRDIPVLTLTGEAGPEALAQSIRLDAEDCFAKPMEMPILRAKLERILRRAGAAKPGPRRQRAGAILHVEGNGGWAALVRAWLRGKGCSHHHVQGRKAMLDYLGRAKTPPDCILLDLDLPDAKGAAVYDELKAAPALRGIPVVVFALPNGRGNERLDRPMLQVVEKSQRSREALLAAVEAAIIQQERSIGIEEAGDLRLDPRGFRVLRGGADAAVLNLSLYSVLRLLASRSPHPVPDLELCRVAGEGRPCAGEAPGVACRTLETYVCGLRRALGKELGRRIRRVKGVGYVYIEPRARSF
jgi:DNA-binding response OmpR family regulator